jgi:hypothetical protein
MFEPHTFETLRESTAGVILLGAVGSLIATAIAFAARYLKQRYVKGVSDKQYRFGCIAGFTEGEMNNLPIFINFVSSHVAKIMLLCTITLVMVIISLFSFVMSQDLLGYGFSIIPLSAGVYTFVTAHTNFTVLNETTDFWIASRRKEGQTTSSAGRRTSRAEAARVPPNKRV